MQKSRKIIYFIAPLLVLVTMILIWMIQGIYPFGDMSFAGVDSYGQYLPFFARYIDKIKTGESFFYTWSASLGTNFWSVNAYYTNSPLNLLFVILGKDNLNLCYGILRVLKLMICAFSMSYFLLHKKGVRCSDTTVVALSLMYALNNYMLGYSWSINWFDSIMVLPLIILGLEYTMDGRTPMLYILSLFYAVFCNFYMGYIICLFVLIYFFSYSFDGMKDMLKKGMRIFGYSIISILMSMVILLPVYFALKQTAPRTTTTENLTGFFDIIKHFMVTDDMCQTTYESGNYNLFVCSIMLPVLIRSLRDRKRWYLTVIYFLSFLSTSLDYVWHGFSSQNGVPGRYTFTFVFYTIILINDLLGTYSADKKSYIEAILCSAVAIALYVMCAYLEADVSTVSLLISSAVLLVCLVSYMLAGKIGIRFIVYLLMCETLIHAVYVTGNLDKYRYSDTGYDTDILAEAYDKINEAEAGDGDVSFYRTDLASLHDEIINEAIKDGFNGISSYSSTMYHSVQRFFMKLGFLVSKNHVYYGGQTPFTDSLLNVKYNVVRDSDYNLTSFEYYDKTENTTIYKNRYPLSIAFSVNDDVKDISYIGAWDKNALGYQNLIARSMTGIDDELYSSDTGITELTMDGNTYTASFDISADGDYCIYQDAYADELVVRKNGAIVIEVKTLAEVYYLKGLEEGDVVSIEYIYIDDSDADVVTASNEISLYKVNDSTKIYEALSKNLLTVTEVQGNSIEGSINVPEGQTIFTSIPYDESWKLYVDGEEAEYYEVLETFIGIDVSSGVHDIRLVYVPYGFYPGLALSLIGVIGCVIVAIIEISGRKKRDG